MAYDPEAGVFLWRKSRKGSAQAGCVVGYLHESGYWKVNIGKEPYMCHLLAWFVTYGEWCPGQIDHINRDKTDNRIENLRKATLSQNSANKPTRGNKYGVPGVYRSAKTRDGHYCSHIRVQGEAIYLGTFPSLEEAAAAYRAAARHHFGEFSPV